MFKKKENGFSLVELAVAAAIATALAVVAVTVVTGTATSVSEKGSSAAAAETCTISESLKGGTDETINDCGTATSGSTSSTPYDFTPNYGTMTYSSAMGADSWSEQTPVLVIDYLYGKYYFWVSADSSWVSEALVAGYSVTQAVIDDYYNLNGFPQGKVGSTDLYSEVNVARYDANGNIVPLA